MNIADAVLSGVVAQVQAQSDPNAIAGRAVLQQYTARGDIALDLERVQTMKLLKQLIKEEKAEDEPDTDLLDAWKGMLRKYKEAATAGKRSS